MKNNVIKEAWNTFLAKIALYIGSKEKNLNGTNILTLVR